MQARCWSVYSGSVRQAVSNMAAAKQRLSVRMSGPSADSDRSIRAPECPQGNRRPYAEYRYWQQSGLKDHESDGMALLIRGRRGAFAVLCQAPKDESSPISGQNLRNIGLVTAFELLGLLGTALYRCQ